jgi:UDP-N-acetylmuramyl pentapeptide phosphotransferase/UDP-N-acetylglucosamine-1-phosphate transferase
MAAALPVTAAVLTWALTWAFIRILDARNRLEPLGARSMHAAPIASGAGIVIIAISLGVFLTLAPEHNGSTILVVTLAGLLAALSWIDDHHGGLSPALRLIAHVVAVTVVLFQLDGTQRMVPALPLVLERVLIGVAWVWLINLYNFMDGIDGLAGSETIAVALGYSLVVMAIGATGSSDALALVMAGATAGYLTWNWPPAKVMMGDAGSVPLGFLVGWLMIDLALRGQLAAALILPLYFLIDATWTLARRLLRGEIPWRPHREHAYQRAALASGSHAAVVWRVIAANIALVALAVLSVRLPVIALVCSASVVAILMIHLERMTKH